MVRHSARQKKLQRVYRRYCDALEEESELNEDLADAFDTEVSDALADDYMEISESRYFLPRIYARQQGTPLIEQLDACRSTDQKLFRGLVRMKPRAFYDLVDKMSLTKAFGNGMRSKRWVGKCLSVALYRLGRYGNAGGERDTSVSCACSVGSVIRWTTITLDGLDELERDIMTSATEEERAKASSWVQNRTGVEDWGRGWLVVDGTLVKLDKRPALEHRQFYTRKGFYALNIALVVLPHSFRIVEYVVGFRGATHDSRVWAGGSQILEKPRRYLDEGEFVWTDGGYGFSPFTLGPFTHRSASQSNDLKKFNATLSSVRVRVEHAITYLKSRFQCLKDYRGNLYRDIDEHYATRIITGCIILHTFASRYDSPRDVAAYLFPSNSTSEAANAMAEDLARYQDSAAEARTIRTGAQRAFEDAEARETEGMSQGQKDTRRKNKYVALREEMFSHLFAEKSWPIEDTDAESRRFERTMVEHARTVAAHAARRRRPPQPDRPRPAIP